MFQKVSLHDNILFSQYLFVLTYLLKLTIDSTLMLQRPHYFRFHTRLHILSTSKVGFDFQTSYGVLTLALCFPHPQTSTRRYSLLQPPILIPNIFFQPCSFVSNHTFSSSRGNLV